MSAIVKCPHCNKDVELGVINMGEPSEVPPTPEPTIPNPPTSPKPIKSDFKGTLVNVTQASQMRNSINVEGTIERKGESRTINLKSGGTLDTCDVFLVDNSGEIKLTLWGEDIKKIDDGKQIRIENGYTNMFKGEVSLTKGKYGKLIIL